MHAAPLNYPKWGLKRCFCSFFSCSVAGLEKFHSKIFAASPLSLSPRASPCLCFLQSCVGALGLLSVWAVVCFHQLLLLRSSYVSRSLVTLSWGHHRSQQEHSLGLFTPRHCGLICSSLCLSVPLSTYLSDLLLPTELNLSLWMSEYPALPQCCMLHAACLHLRKFFNWSWAGGKWTILSKAMRCIKQSILKINNSVFIVLQFSLSSISPPVHLFHRTSNQFKMFYWHDQSPKHQCKTATSWFEWGNTTLQTTSS